MIYHLSTNSAHVFPSQFHGKREDLQRFCWEVPYGAITNSEVSASNSLFLCWLAHLVGFNSEPKIFRRYEQVRFTAILGDYFRIFFGVSSRTGFEPSPTKTPWRSEGVDGWALCSASLRHHCESSPDLHSHQHMHPRHTAKYVIWWNMVEYGLVSLPVAMPQYLLQVWKRFPFAKNEYHKWKILGSKRSVTYRMEPESCSSFCYKLLSNMWSVSISRIFHHQRSGTKRHVTRQGS